MIGHEGGPLIDARPPEKRAYTVAAAHAGGFVVQGESWADLPPPILFAGTLPQCLGYIQEQLTPAREVKSVDVKGGASWQAPHAPKTEGKAEINFPEYEPRRDPEDWPTVWTASQGEAHLRAVCGAADAVATAVEEVSAESKREAGIRPLDLLAIYLREISRGARPIRATLRP